MSSEGRLRIVSEGRGSTTKVLLVKSDGTEVDITKELRVTKIVWHVEAREKAKVTLECTGAEVDLSAEIVEGLPPRIGTWFT